MKIVYIYVLTLCITIFPTKSMAHYINLRKPVQDTPNTLDQNTLDQAVKEIMSIEKTQNTLAGAVQEIMSDTKTQQELDGKAAELAKNIQKEIINLQQRIEYFQKIHKELTVAEKQELMNLRQALREQQRDASGDVSAGPTSATEFDQEPTIIYNTDSTKSK